MNKYVLLACIMILLAACSESGPQKTLNIVADALEKKEPTLFLSQIDMERFAAAQINNMTESSKPLKALDAVGKMLGLGGMENLIGAVNDMQDRENARFTRGVSTGELVLMCKDSKKPDCPWVPDALRHAKINTISDKAAVAHITTPTNISSWLALAKFGEQWKIVAQSPLQESASDFAQDIQRIEEQTPVLDLPAPPPPPNKKEEPEKAVRF